MFKRYCKLIFITLVIALAFTAFSFSAYAVFDPISAAMAGSGVASGFPITGFSGLTPDAASTILNPGVSDPYDWGVLDRYSSVHINNDDDTAEITLSPDIARAGERRLEAVNQAFGLAPGTVHLIGNYPAIGGYVFTHRSASIYYGDIFAYFDRSVLNQTLNLENWASLNMIRNSNTSFKTQGFVGQNSSAQSNHSLSGGNQGIFLRFINYNVTPSSNWYFNFAYVNSTGSTVSASDNVTVSSQDIIVTNYSCNIGRTNDSSIVDPIGRVNKITIPKSYINDITFTPDTTINDISTIESLLGAILEAYTEDDIQESIYIDVGPTPPGPTPVPGDTVSDTLWDDFKDYFDESLGDIYDDLHDFKEGFGDWVEDVASGWTEVFGDIYDDLHGFKESFGDWVEDVASGWTEIFGDIYSTLSGTISSTLSTIASTVQSLVSTIENADFEFIDAFWKNFLTPFSNLFNTIKSHLSIWHYVVEWLASISNVFTFYLGVFSGAGSGYLLPIYACFAGTVVIAVYKRFGK